MHEQQTKLTPQEGQRASESLPLAGKTALIIGASRGIGAEICREFARQGAGKLLIVSRGSAQETMEDVRQYGYGIAVSHIVADISTQDGVAHIVNTVMESGTAIDSLVLNAGMRGDSLVENYTYDDFGKVIDTNLRGPFVILSVMTRNRLFSEKSKTNPRQGPSITIIGSVVGEQGNYGQSAYAATKSAWHGLTKTLSRELMDTHGIRVNLVEPGFIATDMTEDLTKNPRARRVLETLTPVGRVGTPEDIAPLVAFLASQEAAFITGSIITADGGLGGAVPAIFTFSRGNSWERLSPREVRMLREHRAAQQGNTQQL